MTHDQSENRQTSLTTFLVQVAEIDSDIKQGVGLTTFLQGPNRASPHFLSVAFSKNGLYSRR